MAADIQNIDFSVNILRALLWQYNKAETLQALVQSKQDWDDENQKEFWENWIRDVFDLRTANTFGLRVWSIILELPLFVNDPPPPVDKPTWGFGGFRYNFRGANFTNRNGSSVNLPLETKRLALRLRYFQITSSGTVPETNRMLAYLFGEMGGAHLNDGHNMTQEYFFNFQLPWYTKYLFDNFDVLPRPAGVGSSYRDSSQNYWGFGQYRLNFGRGNFGV